MRASLMAFVASCLLGSGCSPTNGNRDSTEGGAKPLRVVATTGMIADAVNVIGKNHVNVSCLMGPGIDPHQYKATAGDLKRMQSADLVLYNGLHLEGKMADIFDQMSNRTRTVAVARTLDVTRDLRPAPEGFEGTHDPHVWFDVQLWMRAVEVVREALTEAKPAQAAEFAANAEAYLKELAALHNEVKEKAGRIPSDRRVLITAHDAFFYFGRAYGFEVHGLQGISTVSEPSTRDVQALAKLIGDRKVPAIFGETSVPDRNIQAVRDAVVKGYGFEVNFIPGQLYSDALGDAGTPAGTYVGMVRHNIDTIVGALGK